MRVTGSLLISLVFPSLVLSATHHTLPKNFKQCKKNDPNVSKCLQKAVPDAFRKMKEGGVASLGVLPLEPLIISDIKIDPGAGRPVSLKLHFKNIHMYGIPETTFETYDARLKEGRLISDAYTPKLWFEADYVADGKVLILPIKGKGRCNITMFELKTYTDLAFTPEKKNGETYWMIQKFENKFKPKKVSMYFEGLIADKAISATVNQFLNQNWKEIFEELRPNFEDAFGAVFKEITHRVFSRVPVNKIFLS